MRKQILLFCLSIVCYANLAAQNKALLVIDIQNDYFHGGAMELVGAEEAAANAQKVIGEFRASKLPVVYIQHVSEYQGATFFLPNTCGQEISRLVEPTACDKIIEKRHPNSFKETELLTYLREKGVTELVIVGMMTHMCVDATTRAAADLGFRCTVVADACATRNAVYDGVEVPARCVQAAFVAALKGAYATIVTANDFSL